MKSAIFSAIVLSASLGSAQTTAPTAPSNGETLLKAVMDRYHSLKSLSVNSAAAMDVAGQKSFTVSKNFEYVAPNQFSLKESVPGQGDLKMVCDGKTFLTFMTGPQSQAITDKAPESIWTISAPPMSNPLVSNVVITALGGAVNYGNLVDSSKTPVTLGKEETAPDGEKAIHIDFVGKSQFSPQMDLLVGEDNKTIYSSTMAISGGKGGDGAAHIKETFSGFQPEAVISATEFSTTAPKGVKVQDMATLMAQDKEQEDAQDKPPVPLGSLAPDFKVYSLKDGMPMKLSSLKGHVVMIDFWATWCPPCRESLPHTQDIFKQYTGKNVTVVTISDEEAKVIRDFVQQNKYTFPVYRDPSDGADKAYGITGIPTIAIIDASGKLSAFMVGLRDESDILAALKKAGVK